MTAVHRRGRLTQTRPVATARYRTLAQSVLTGRGTYVRGLEVIQLQTQRRGWARICLDPYGCHFGGRCHSVHVPHAWLQPPDAVPRSRSTTYDSPRKAA